MVRTGRRRRGGWRRQGNRIQVYVRLHGGKGGLRTQPFPLATSPGDLQAWIDDHVTDYRKHHPKGEPGTLQADVDQYLKLLVNRPALQRDRRTKLAWWCASFGHRSRWSLKPIELETKLNELLASGKAASTVKKFRTALYHLWTKLDGKNASNPLRDVQPPREPEALPRALPYTIIDQILMHVPDRIYARRLTVDETTTIRFRLRTETNVSAIAREYSVSETAIRHIRSRRHPTRHERPSKAKARLMMMAYLGWAPAMLRAFRPEDYDRQTQTILARGRKKGGGSRAVRHKLLPDGIRAVEAFIAADAFERDRPDGTRSAFSMTPVLRAWRVGIRRLCETLEREDATRELGQHLRTELARATPYSLRHSFLTEMQLATGNIQATQNYAVHADARMTQRYTLAAVSPELEAAAAALAARLTAQRARNELRNESRPAMSEIGGIRPKSDRALKAHLPAKPAAKVRNASRK